MPEGMLLRSNWTATQIADPNRSLTLEAFRSVNGNHLAAPVPLDRFVQYGLWYQRQAIPDLDQRKVICVESSSNGFRLTLEDREEIHCRRVIVAAGIGTFARRPQEFQSLPNRLVSHTSEHQNLRKFEGKRVLVIGGGQSGLESGALLHEAGVDVEVIARALRIHWLGGFASTTLHHRLGGLTRNLLYAPTDVGPAGISQLMARPDWVRRLPRTVQNKLWKRSVRPAGARWLVKRLQGVPIRLGRWVVSATPAGAGVQVTLNDGSTRTVDHILLGTGYRIDLTKYHFLAPELLRGIDCAYGYPLLKAGLETSVPGLHILGAPAAWSFGPLMQFVSGTTYASRALLRAISGEARVGHERRSR